MPLIKILKSTSGKGKRPTILTEEAEQNLKEFKRINKTLTLKKMLAGEPWATLPRQYYPSSNIGLNPPQFSYGLSFTQQELTDFAIASNMPLISAEGSVIFPDDAVAYCLTRRLRSNIIPVKRISGQPGDVILAITSNSGRPISREVKARVGDWFKATFNRDPGWWVTEWDQPLKESYKIPEAMIWEAE